MGKTRVFDRDPFLGTLTLFHEEDDGGYTLETRQDVTDVLEANKILHADTDERARYGENLQRVASVPLIIWHQWEREGDINDPKYLRKKLNDRDNLLFRTRPGKI